MRLLRKRWNRWRIAAPKLTVRARVPWYWYAFVIAAVAALGLTTALWTYDAGRRFGGPNTAALESEIATLRKRVAELEAEAEGLRAAAASNESRLQIEKTAAVQLARQLKSAEGEIAQLREDLAFFDNLAVRDSGDGRLTVTAFKVDRDALPGEYRYRVLISQGGRKEREFKGRLQFIVETQLNGADVAVVVPHEHDEDAAYRVSFRRFYRAEGSFKIDPAATVRSVQVRVFEQGADHPRVTHNYAML